MTEPTINDPVRAAIVALLRTVPNIGVVHGYERYVANQADMQSLYVQGGLLCGWFVRRITIKESREGGTKEIARWQIRGYRGFSDGTASELAFDDLIDAIRAAFRGSNLGGLALTATDDGAGIQLEQSGPVMFGGVLAHAATLTLTTERFIDA